ncbi:MAG: methyltransferase [Bacteroidales bacterium]|nr:methyltransferase [Bacteroidales bacterium]
MSFQFRNFHVNDAHTAMKVGTDAVLLGTWTPVCPSDATIVDAGAGSGVVSLLMAERNQDAHVIGVEIDAAAAADCRENFAESPWARRMTVVESALEDWTPDRKVDLIISNPPFFTETLRSPDGRRASARHCGTMSPLTVMDFAAHWLNADGRLAMITACGNRRDVLFHGELQGLHLHALTHVCPREGSPEKRLLWLWGRASVSEYAETCLCIRDARGNWCDDYVSLVDDFYLRMPNP